MWYGSGAGFDSRGPAKGVEMEKECWCVAYHHPEYERHPENETWFCECCARGHKLPNTKYIDEALDQNAVVMTGSAPPPFVPPIANENLAPVMFASGFAITNPRTYVIVEPRAIIAPGLIIYRTRIPRSTEFRPEFLRTIPGM